MGDWPDLRQTLPLLCSFGEYGIGLDVTLSEVLAPASTAWSSASRAVYIPFAIPFPFWVRRIWWCNGATASGSMDCGVVDGNGTPIFTTGTQTQTNASVLQSAAPTQGAGILMPGSYYLALSNNGTTGTYTAYSPITRHGQMLGLQIAASQEPLAASPTFATYPGGICVPLCGIANVTTL